MIAAYQSGWLILATASAKEPSVFWIVMSIIWGLATLYMTVTWYRVKTGTRRHRKSYLAYLTTKRYREIWERQKLNPFYYSLRGWIAFAGTVFCLLRVIYPDLR